MRLILLLFIQLHWPMPNLKESIMITAELRTIAPIETFRHRHIESGDRVFRTRGEDTAQVSTRKAGLSSWAKRAKLHGLAERTIKIIMDSSAT
jgi:hypothetical protein